MMILGLVPAMGGARRSCPGVHGREHSSPGACRHGHAERRRQQLRQRERLEDAGDVVRSRTHAPPRPKTSLLQGREGHAAFSRS